MKVERSVVRVLIMVMVIAMATSCASKKNTSRTRFWKAFNARYNTFYNGKQAFIDATAEQQAGNKDNYTEMLPLYVVANKATRSIGTANYDRAIEKAQKDIKLYGIKTRPEWTKKRRKTAKDIEWLSRREYNPFIWKAWMLLGKSQFYKGLFDESAATFSYISRLYATQPAISGVARAWLSISYAELDWLYDAEDVITKMSRDSMHYKAKNTWDYAYADYYIRSGNYAQGTKYLREVIKHEKNRKQKARQWFIMGQMQAQLGNKEQAYKAFKHVVRCNPPYELEFNARIAQTEVLATGRDKQMIRRLKRMARSDKNADYLDQVYYAIGNIYIAQRDTANAIAAYEKGAAKATRSGIEKGVLMLTLGNIYWEKERYADAQRCYSEALGLLDKERDDYAQLDKRSKILDELVPYTEAVHLQDSLQWLATLTEAQRLEIIDKVIEDLKKKEKEEEKARQEAEAEQALAQAGAAGAKNTTTTSTATDNTSGTFYFYNQQAISQGKTQFQRLWGKRENVDDWQRANRTVVSLNTDEEDEGEGEEESADSIDNEGIEGEMSAEELAIDSTAIADSIAADPHNREYYIAQIPFTEEKIAESNAIIMDGLFHSGVIFKDKLDNMPLAEKALSRLINNFPEYENNDEAYYHLYLLYSRIDKPLQAQQALDSLKALYPESDYTTLLSDPYFVENSRFGVHIEDSIYGATYNAFKENEYDVVKANTALSESRFPLGANRPKFIFIEGLSLLGEGDAAQCIERMKTVVEKYPTSEVAELAGMIVKGVQQGRQLYGGRYDLGDIWSRRTIDYTTDSTSTDSLTDERQTSYVFMLAFIPDSVNANQLIYDLAKYNFTAFMVRNFDLSIDEDNGIGRMVVSGFANYDEAIQYARKLYADEGMTTKLQGCKRVIISEKNLALLGTRYSYADYEDFFDAQIAPAEISNDDLLNIPETIVQEKEEEQQEQQQEEVDEFGFPTQTQQRNNNNFDFDDDFYF